MKLAIITDQHFGARKGADYIHRYFKKFYDNIFFPYLEKNKIDTIVDMGDTFDNRRNIDLATLEWSKKNYYDRLRSMGIKVHTIVGNPNKGPTNVTNALFVGSTAELSKLIKNQNKDDK